MIRISWLSSLRSRCEEGEWALSDTADLGVLVRAVMQSPWQTSSFSVTNLEPASLRNYLIYSMSSL